MKALTSSSRLVNRLVRCCVGSTFVGCVSAVIVYAFHGWTWPSEINGLALNLPEFVGVVVLLTLVVGICIDYRRTKQQPNMKVGARLTTR
jgi:hypothetical protein